MTTFSAIVVIIVLLLSSVKTDSNSRAPKVTSSIQSFKDSMTKMIKEQSTKIGDVLKKIQSNAQLVLKKIKNINENRSFGKVQAKYKDNYNRYIEDESQNQIEPPMTDKDKKNTYVASRSFGTHYSSTGYGTSGNAHAPTYHHHSIGFDPINIVVSMSLISFLLQAFQGLLIRTRLPTPVVEAKALNYLPMKPRKMEPKKKELKKKEYFKNRFDKPYLR